MKKDLIQVVLENGHPLPKWVNFLFFDKPTGGVIGLEIEPTKKGDGFWHSEGGRDVFVCSLEEEVDEVLVVVNQAFRKAFSAMMNGWLINDSSTPDFECVDAMFDDGSIESIEPRFIDWSVKRDMRVLVYRQRQVKKHNAIVCAAIRNSKTGDVVKGHRHGDSHMQHAIKVKNWCPQSFDEQGFIDMYGNYQSREDALKIVKENGQLWDEERNGSPSEWLFSEGLY